MKYILINGKKRSGKDYFAEQLKTELEKNGKSVFVISYADPIKDIISTTLELPMYDLDTFKNNPEEYGLELKVYPNNQPQVIYGYRTIREILQLFGTEAMKKWFGEDVWVQLLKKHSENSGADYVLVPDFRFLSEYLDDSITVKIINNKENDNTDTHRSENELNDFIFDYEIDNTGYVDLTDQIEEFMFNIGK